MCEAMEKLETFRNSTLIGMLERWIRNASLIYRSIVVELKFVEEVPDDPFSIFPLLAKGERGGFVGPWRALRLTTHHSMAPVFYFPIAKISL